MQEHWAFHWNTIKNACCLTLVRLFPGCFRLQVFFLQLVRWRSLDFKLSVSSSSFSASSSTSSFSPPLRRSRVHADPAQSPRSADSWWQWGSSSWNSWSTSSWQRRDWQGAVAPWVGGQGVQYIQIQKLRFYQIWTRPRLWRCAKPVGSLTVPGSGFSILLADAYPMHTDEWPG